MKSRVVWIIGAVLGVLLLAGGAYFVSYDSDSYNDDTNYSDTNYSDTNTGYSVGRY